MHDKNILHLNITLNNIVKSFDGRFKYIDFGCSVKLHNL